jgi:hypothetical protein
MKHLLLIIYCSLFIFLSGCGDNVKLRGRVTFPDGEPLKTGTIYFSTPLFQARANIRPDGYYDAGSLSEKDGLPAGTYKVYIVGAIEENEDPADETLRPLIAAEFVSEKTTPLEVTVPGENVYNITVEKPKPVSTKGNKR